MEGEEPADAQRRGEMTEKMTKILTLNKMRKRVLTR